MINFITAMVLATTPPQSRPFDTQDRDAIARVAFAEAGNQGDSGLAAVVRTILNRLWSGRWGASIDAVLDAPHQFEPVMRVGGDWRNLKPASAAQQAQIDTILNLTLDGRLPDLTGGALYFQNPTIVAARAAAGQAPARLVNFAGAKPSAVIGAHAFYAATAPTLSVSAPDPSAAGGRQIFIGTAQAPQMSTPTDARAIFILTDGRLVEDRSAR